MNAYYTHRPYLKEELDKIVLKNKKCFILELGVGDGSSEILHEYAKKFPLLRIIGIETDSSWANSIRNKYELRNYKIIHINNWSNELYELILSFIDNFDLVFVDQSPWQARIDAIDALRGKFETLILHDYDYYNPNDYKYSCDKNSYFHKYMDDYKLIGFYDTLPPTLLIKQHDQTI